MNFELRFDVKTLLTYRRDLESDLIKNSLTRALLKLHLIISSTLLQST